MARQRWVNGNQVGYGSGAWYRYVLDRDISGNTITVWWGVETNAALSDSSNSGDTNFNGQPVTFSNVSISHGSGGGTTWFREQSFGVDPGATATFSGFVRNLAEGSGGGATSSVYAEWTNPASTAKPPNQMNPARVTNIAPTTHTVNFDSPVTNGAVVTGYEVQWHTTSLFKQAFPSGTPVQASGFTPNTEYGVIVRALSDAGPSPWSPVTYFRQAPAAPLAPSAPTVTRNSDTSHSLTWTRASQTQGPYDSQQVLRRNRRNGVWHSWVVVATVSRTATSYTDETTIRNRAYEYSVRATNESGTATSPSSTTVWTSPNQPATASAAKNASNDIVVSWTPPDEAPNPANLAYRVHDSQDGGTTWVHKVDTAAGASSWTHAAPESAVHQYAVSPLVSATGQVGHGLVGYALYTNSVALLAAPAAPTELKSTPEGTVDRTAPVVLSWRHNPTDTTEQTKFTLEHRLAGTTTWTTVTVTSAASSYTLPGGTYPTGTAFEWRVLTYGLHANPSPYSATATVQISSAPGVNISTPTEGGVVVSTSLTVEWTFSDPEGDTQGSWEASLLQNGVVLETLARADTATSATFTRRLAETAYSVRVRVRDSRGLWSTHDTRNFTVEYPAPPTPVISLSTWDWKHGTVQLSLSLPEPTAEQVPATHLEVWRSIDDGPLKLLSGNLPPLTASYLDVTPTVDGKNTYVIQALSDVPSASESDVTAAFSVVTTPGPDDQRPAVWLSGGPGFAKIGRLASEVTVDAERIRERVLQRYAGRPMPVTHTGEHITETWSVSGNLNLRWASDTDEESSPDTWLELGEQEGVFLLRAPSLFGGPTIYTYVSVDGPRVSRAAGGNVHKVSFTATRTEGPS